MIEKIVPNHRFEDYAILEFRDHFVIRSRSQNIQGSKSQEPFFLDRLIGRRD